MNRTHERGDMKARFARLRAVDPILIQAVIAAAISFSHIHDIAAAAGQGGWKAWAYPVSVDLLLVMAWRRIRVARNTGVTARGPWLWFVLSLAASLGANVATAGVLDMTNLPVWLRVSAAGWPVLAFFGGSLLIHSRTSAADPHEGSTEPQEPVGEPAEGELLEEAGGAPEEPQKPFLVTYAEAAARLRMSEVTVRGAANTGRLTKYTDGPTPNRIHVDLGECLRRLRHDRPVSV